MRRDTAAACLVQLVTDILVAESRANPPKEVVSQLVALDESVYDPVESVSCLGAGIACAYSKLDETPRAPINMELHIRTPYCITNVDITLCTLFTCIIIT